MLYSLYMATPQRCERIVILGAGFGGLTTAVQLSKRLGKRPGCEIVVVDKCTHHLYRPWLYEVATGDAPEDRLKSGVATPYEDLRTHLSSLGVKETRARRHVGNAKHRWDWKGPPESCQHFADLRFFPIVPRFSTLRM